MYVLTCITHEEYMKKGYIFNKCKLKLLDNYMIILHLKKYIKFLCLKKNEWMRKKRECVQSYLPKFN